MSDSGVAKRFEDRITEGPKICVIEAAFDQDLMWINVAASYGFGHSEQATLRSYIRRTYSSKGKRRDGG